MNKVLKFTGPYYGKLNATNLLEVVAKENPKNVFIIVWPDDGSVPTYHSSTGDTPVVLFRLQEFIHKLYNGEFDTK